MADLGLIPVENRVVEHPNRYKLELVNAEENIYDLVAMPGAVAAEGTMVDKALLEAMQQQTIDLDSSLATVAKTGTYADLSGRPSIPSVSGIASSVIKTGTYRGNSTTEGGAQRIYLGISPKAVLVVNRQGTDLSGGANQRQGGFLALRGYNATANGETPVLSISGSYIDVYHYGIASCNVNNGVFYWIAFM